MESDLGGEALEGERWRPSAGVEAKEETDSLATE